MYSLRLYGRGNRRERFRLSNATHGYFGLNDTSVDTRADDEAIDMKEQR